MSGIRRNAGPAGRGPARDVTGPWDRNWEVVHPEIPFAIYTKNVRRTIEKLLAKYPDSGMWVSPPGSFFYYAIDAEIYSKLKRGEAARTIYTDTPGRASAAYGKAVIGPEFLGGV